MNPPKPPKDSHENPADITYFAQSDYRNRNTKFGIRREDRTRHMYVIGKTGMGKTTLLQNMAIQDIRGGNGLAFIDPHGEVADSLLDYVPEERKDDVMYFAPFDLEHPISFNVMEDVGPDKRHLVADGLLSAFKKIWVDMWSGRMEYLLNNALLALLEYPDSTILGVNRMFADEAYRKRVVANVSDVSVKAFWEDEYANYDQNFARQAASAIQNKVGQFVSNPQVRNIVGQVESSFDVRDMMDSRKIMLINLSKGQVGEDNARLIGSMLITKMYLAAMSRADTGTQGGDLSKLPQFYFYVDEFQSFANESFAGILSEARKYKLNLTIAHQYIEQMDEDVRNAVFGNVGTMIAFRVGAFDAEVLEKEFAPEFEAEDLVNLGFAQIYLKLMINGVSSKPFSARTLPPFEENEVSYRDQIRELSRQQYGRPRKVVESEIEKWHQSTYGIIDDEEARAMAETQRKQREASGKEPLPQDKRELVKKYEVDQVINGTVVGIADFGIFVEIERGLEGLVHISELGEDHVDDPRDLYSEDDEVTAKVIGIEDDKVSLSIKQLEVEEQSDSSDDAVSDEPRQEREADEVPSKEQSDDSGDDKETKEDDAAKAANDKTKEDTSSEDAEQEQESEESEEADSEKKKKQEPAKKAADNKSDKEPEEKEKPNQSAEKKKRKQASLSDLEKKQSGDDEKGPTEANKSKLQAALSQVADTLSGKKAKRTVDDEAKLETSTDGETKEEKQPKATAERTTQSPAKESEAPEEIPEDQLREMLSVDEDEKK